MALVNTKKTALFIKSGATVPVPPANFLEVEEEIILTPNVTITEFKRINGKLGSNDSYADTCDTTISQTVAHKMRSSNSDESALETPPAYGELLKIGGFSETITTTTPGEETVVYTNSQTPSKGSALAYVDGYKHSITNSLVADLTFNFAIGKAATISAALSAFIDNAGVATSAAVPSVTLNDEPCLLVSCADIMTAGGTSIKADSIKITMGSQVEKFYGMNIKEFNIQDYTIKVVATFYPENADYNDAINALKAETVEALVIKLGTNGTGSLINGKSVEVTASLGKANSFSDSTDKSTLKREFTWLLQGDSTGKAIEIKHGFFA